MTEPTTSDPTGPEPIARIEAALKQLGLDHEPPAGWEDRVLAATRAPRVRSFSIRRWWRVFAPMLVLAGVVLWLVVRHAEPDELAVSWRIDNRTDVRGVGSDGAVGDVVHAAVTGGRGYRVLRVYRRGGLLLDCRATPDGAVSQEVVERDAADPGQPLCTADRDKLELRLVLRAPGTYKLLGLASPSPLPASQHNFDLDQAYAISAKLYRPSLVQPFAVE